MDNLNIRVHKYIEFSNEEYPTYALGHSPIFVDQCNLFSFVFIYYTMSAILQICGIIFSFFVAAQGTPAWKLSLYDWSTMKFLPSR